MAGAAYLDQSPDSINNATEIVNNAISKQTSLSMGDSNLSVQNVTFFDFTGTVTSAPSDAVAIGVTIEPEDVDLVFYADFKLANWW